MDTAQPDPTAPTDLDALVDRGSWNAFTPSLADLLASCQAGAGPLSQLLLTAPAPVVTAATLASSSRLRALLRRSRRPVASPQVPGIVLTPGPGGTHLAVPVLDEAGRVLLGPAACATLQSLGWRRHVDVLERSGLEAGEAAQAVTRVLIEVLDVAHPADLDWLAQPCDSSTTTS